MAWRRVEKQSCQAAKLFVHKKNSVCPSVSDNLATLRRREVVRILQFQRIEKNLNDKEHTWMAPTT